nr:hypothetical protein [uncultured Prevotella sp.]
MKRLVLSIAIITAVFSASAQTFVKPELKKGDVAHYENETTMKISLPMGSGTKQVKTTSLSTITVKDVNDKGALLEDVTSKLNIEGEAVLADNTLGAGKYLVDTPILFQTDKNGKLIKIVNYNDIIAKISKGAIADIEKLYKENPALEKNVSKAKLIMALSTKFSEENLLKTFTQTGIYSVYGKTFKNGNSEIREFNWLKIKTTWGISSILGTTSIVGYSKANMNSAETKDYIFSQLKEQGLDDDAIQGIKNNWEQLKQMGLDKVDANITEHILLSSKKMVTNYSTKAKMMVMGSEVELNSNTKLLDK